MGQSQSSCQPVEPQPRRLSCPTRPKTLTKTPARISSSASQFNPAVSAPQIPPHFHPRKPSSLIAASSDALHQGQGITVPECDVVKHLDFLTCFSERIPSRHVPGEYSFDPPPYSDLASHSSPISGRSSSGGRSLYHSTSDNAEPADGLDPNDAIFQSDVDVQTRSTTPILSFAIRRKPLPDLPCIAEVDTSSDALIAAILSEDLDEDSSSSIWSETDWNDVVLRDAPERGQPSVSFECVSCLEEIPPENLPTLPIASDCNFAVHDLASWPKFCTACIAKTLSAQLEENGHESLKCPTCRIRLSYDDVRRWASPELFDKYDRILTEEALASNSEFVWCAAPNCETGQVHSGGEAEPILTCFKCQRRTCIVHHMEYHEGFSCQQYDLEQEASARRVVPSHGDEDQLIWPGRGDNTARQQRINGMEEARGGGRLREKEREARKRQRREREQQQAQEEKLQRERKRRTEEKRRQQEKEREAQKQAEERLSERTKLARTKACPGCNKRIELASGCKHMTCRCGHEFCYRCLQTWKTGHLDSHCGSKSSS